MPEAHKVSGFAGKNNIMKKIFETIAVLIAATILIILRYMDNVIISIFLPWNTTRKINPNEQLRRDEIIRVFIFFTIYFLLKLF